MKNLTILTVTLSSFLFFNNALANPNGGYTGPQLSSVVNTVAKAKSSWDETKVTLTGKITGAIGDEKYNFTDSTGTIVVEIDNDKWYGITVDQNSVITLHGEVDKDWNRTIVDVDSLILK